MPDGVKKSKPGRKQLGGVAARDMNGLALGESGISLNARTPWCHVCVL